MSVAFLFLSFMYLGARPGDARVYLLAGERLNNGHEVYRLLLGDTPVPYFPPGPPIPLHGPPLIAVVFRPLALLPGESGAVAWWVAMIVLMGLTVALLASRSPGLGGLVLLTLCIPLSWVTVVGNVDVLVIAGSFAIWGLAKSGREVMAGVIVGLLVSLKLTPLAILAWLFVTRRWRAVGASVAAIAILAAVVVVGAGVGTFRDYVDVAFRVAAEAPGSHSLAAIGLVFGLSPDLARWIPWIAIGAGLLAAAALGRRRDGASFTVAALVMATGSPAAALHTPALLLVALAPVVVSGRGPARRQSEAGPPLSAPAIGVG